MGGNVRPERRVSSTLFRCGTARRSKRVEASSEGDDLTGERSWREGRVSVSPTRGVVAPRDP